MRGEATFIAMDGVVFSLIGYAADPDWDIWEYDIERAVSSFRPVAGRPRGSECPAADLAGGHARRGYFAGRIPRGRESARFAAGARAAETGSMPMPF